MHSCRNIFKNPFAIKLFKKYLCLLSDFFTAAVESYCVSTCSIVVLSRACWGHKFLLNWKAWGFLRPSSSSIKHSGLYLSGESFDLYRSGHLPCRYGLWESMWSSFAVQTELHFTKWRIFMARLNCRDNGLYVLWLKFSLFIYAICGFTVFICLPPVNRGG